MLAAAGGVARLGKRNQLGSNLPIVASTALAAMLGAAAGWILTRERVRPVEENFVSRMMVRGYVPTLQLFLRHKFAFFLLPTAIIIIGLGGRYVP